MKERLRGWRKTGTCEYCSLSGTQLKIIF